MTIAAVARAIGPTLGAEAFAWSLTSGRRLPLDVHWLGLGLGLGLGLANPDPNP